MARDMEHVGTTLPSGPMPHATPSGEDQPPWLEGFIAAPPKANYRELADRIEQAGLALVRGWDGAFPCKPTDDIVLAAHHFTVAKHLRENS